LGLFRRNGIVETGGSKPGPAAEEPVVVESSLEAENSESEVESISIDESKNAESEIAPIELPELSEKVSVEWTPKEEENADEEIEVTNPSPQRDESEPEPMHGEPPASPPPPPAQEPPEPLPAPPAQEPPQPEPAPPIKAIAAQDAKPASPADPALPADTPAHNPEKPAIAGPITADSPVPEKTTAEKVAAALKARGVDAEQSPFSVIVNQVYDGPLDLLLDLIRKQDIDIYDIPIAKITAQFLAYVDRLRASDMDVAGDFIYTAALLIHIKSKMLLPRAPVGPEESAEDPRRELVDRLLEHERFKNAAQMLHEKQMLEAATWTNPGVREFREDAGAEPEIAADTTDLVRIFRDILDRARNRPILNVEEDSVTVGQMIQFLTRRLTMEDKPVALRRLLSHTHSERALIAMFLGLLELVRLQAILLRQDRQFSEIFVKKNTGFDAVVNEGLSSAHDDWR
jgi:segregation and condensation protein A